MVFTLFFTLRHWKATTEYELTRDIPHVKEMLGHRNINNTLWYTHFTSYKDEEFVSKIAKDSKEAMPLVETGFGFGFGCVWGLKFNPQTQ